jgi:hypothetical protein
MSIYIPLLSGVKIRVGPRGRTRVGVGPRWLRFWAGAGGRSVSTGAEPVSWYHPSPEGEGR